VLDDAGAAGFKKLNPPEGAEGGFGAEGAGVGLAALVLF